MNFTTDPRFAGLTPFENKVWLATPTMHGEEQHWVDEAIRTNWVSTVGENINEVEKQIAEYVGMKYAVGLSSCTAALHLAIRLAGERLYGVSQPGVGTLKGRKVFCSDMTFDACVNPIAYEGGEAVFIDTEYDTWNMNPEALKMAFEIYPEVRIVVVAHLYGTPGKMSEIRSICQKHNAIIIEDAAESLGALYKEAGAWKKTGSWGDYVCLSFNGNKVITGSSGGMLLTNNPEDANKIRKWSTQSREDAPWYQHEELGYNYRMSNIIAGVVRGQFPYLQEHVAQKKTIYERYQEGFRDLPVQMNPFDSGNHQPNFWLSCLIIDEEAMAPMTRGEQDYLYMHEPGKSSPQEILDALAAFNAEGRPIWKPMHMQPIYRNNPFITTEGNGRGQTNAYIAGSSKDIGADIFQRGLCLPSDNKMTPQEQDKVIEIVRRCFSKTSPWKEETMAKRAISFSPPDIGEMEIAEVSEALRSGWVTTGPRTKLLERRLAAFMETGRTDIDCTVEEAVQQFGNRVVCLNSATAAEELNLHVLGIRPGDEVIVPAYTYSASASSVIHCGGTVKFVDIQKNGDAISHMPEMDYEALEAAITPKTKAIVAVDLGGIVCDYDRIFEIVKRKKSLFTPLESDGTPLGDLNSRIQHAIGRVAVVADCAHSLGASRVVKHSGNHMLPEPQKLYCGAIADFTSFSFHAVKNFTTAEGGASTWLPLAGIKNEEIYQMFQLLSLHGQNKDALSKMKLGSWEYDIIGPWYKCNMTDIMAAIGLKQLDRYLGLLKRREDIITKYDAVCEELGISRLVHHTESMDSSNHLFLIRIPGIDEEQRNTLIERFAEEGVSTNVHFKPLPMMTAYGKDCSAYPNAYDYYHNLISIPLHTLLSDEDVEFVCGVMREVICEVVKC